MYYGILFISVVVAAAYIAGMHFAPLADLGGLDKLLFFIAALIVIRAVTAVLWGFLRTEERTKLLNFAMVGTRAGSLALVCLLLLRQAASARTYFLGATWVEAAMVVILSARLIYRRDLGSPRIDTGLLRAGIAFGMPLAVYELAFAVLGSADRFLVQHYLGSNPLGVYSVAYGLAQNANDLVLTPLGLAIQPIYFRLWAAGSPQKTAEFLSVTLDLFLLGGAGLLAVSAAVAKPLVLLLASAKYEGAETLIPVLLAGLLVYATYIFVAAGLLIAKRTLQMAGILVLGAVLNVASNCLLLPWLGLMGSAVATFVSYLACIAMLSRASNRLLPLQWDARALSRYLFAAAVAWLCGTQVSVNIPAVDLLARAALTSFAYLTALYLLDHRVREKMSQAGCLLRRFV
jgi:O-antigen/teichoic acid export membrane protein